MNSWTQLLPKLKLTEEGGTYLWEVRAGNATLRVRQNKSDFESVDLARDAAAMAFSRSILPTA